jgi:hypothetical protein
MAVRGEGTGKRPLKLGGKAGRGGRLDAGAERLRNLREALEVMTPDDVVLMATWARDCPTGRARANRENQCDDPDTWLRPCHREQYLGFAHEWQAQASGAAPSPSNGVNGAAAWEHMLQALNANGFRPPEQYHPHPGVDRAIRAGVDALGGAREVGRVSDFNRAQARQRFIAVYGVHHGA